MAGYVTTLYARRLKMLRPLPIGPVPAETVRVAQAAFSKGNRYVRLADALDTLFTDAVFAGIFPPMASRRFRLGDWHWSLSCSSPKGSPTAKRQRPYAAGSTGNTSCVWNSPILALMPQF